MLVQLLFSLLLGSVAATAKMVWLVLAGAQDGGLVGVLVFLCWCWALLVGVSGTRGKCGRILLLLLLLLLLWLLLLLLLVVVVVVVVVVGRGGVRWNALLLREKLALVEQDGGCCSFCECFEVGEEQCKPVETLSRAH